jgi:dynein regulatory complex protein 1
LGQIDGLFAAHLKIESEIVELRAKKESDYQKEIEDLRIQHAKEYAKQKIKLETEIQNLEKCLEDMKALYLLNTEKLEYNFRVLKEKDEENTQLTGILKTKKRHHQTRMRKAIQDYKDVVPNKFS